MKSLRAWDDVAQKMLYATPEQFDDMLGYRFDGHFETDEPAYMWGTRVPDRNGKEIYEMDVFPPGERTHGEIMIVCYDSKQARYKAVPLSLYKANAGNGGWTGYDINPYNEVIGNIYDNPDLLEG